VRARPSYTEATPGAAVNYLAHIYLSVGSPERLLGGWLGDFVKGRLVDGSYPPAVLEGIRLHRHLDSFVDSHPVFRRSRERCGPRWRRYAGIFVDLFYDHYLARDWHEYADEPLAVFSARFYRLLEEHEALLPERARQVAMAMARDDWLVAYREPRSICRALEGLSRRLRRPVPLAEGCGALKDHYAGFEQDFRMLLPDLDATVRAFDARE